MTGVLAVVERALGLAPDDDTAADERELARCETVAKRLTEALARAEDTHHALAAQRDAGAPEAVTLEDVDCILALDADLAASASRVALIRQRIADHDTATSEVKARIERRHAEQAHQHHMAAIRAALVQMMPLAKQLETLESDVRSTCRLAGITFSPFDAAGPNVPALPTLEHWLLNAQDFLAQGGSE